MLSERAQLVILCVCTSECGCRNWWGLWGFARRDKSTRSMWGLWLDWLFYVGEYFLYTTRGLRQDCVLATESYGHCYREGWCCIHHFPIRHGVQWRGSFLRCYASAAYGISCAGLTAHFRADCPFVLLLQHMLGVLFAMGGPQIQSELGIPSFLDYHVPLLMTSTGEIVRFKLVSHIGLCLSSSAGMSYGWRWSLRPPWMPLGWVHPIEFIYAFFLGSRIAI